MSTPIPFHWTGKTTPVLCCEIKYDSEYPIPGFITPYGNKFGWCNLTVGMPNRNHVDYLEEVKELDDEG
jgi:hypothetical protein